MSILTSKVMFEKIKHIPTVEKDLVTGFICDISQERAILLICGLAAVYYYETEEFGTVSNDMEISSDKTRMTCVRPTVVSIYGRIFIDKRTNYMATWYLRFSVPSERIHYVGIASKKFINLRKFLFRDNIFYVSSFAGNKLTKEWNDFRERDCGTWKGFELDKILKLTLDPKKKQLRMVCGDASTCFNEIKMEYGPFILVVWGSFMKGASVEIIKFEKNY